jgi:hypothetical protein
MWNWLRAATCALPAARLTGLRLRWQGEVPPHPPTALLRAARGRHGAPVDVDLRSWLTNRLDKDAAAAASGAAGC